jgi:hypothetical protein
LGESHEKSSLLAEPNDPQDEKQVLATLDRMAQGMVKKDFAVLTAVFHQDLTYGHSTGHTQTKDEILKDVANPQRIWDAFKFSKPKGRTVAAGALAPEREADGSAACARVT